MSTSVKAVIFDLDGTLVDSAPDIADCQNDVLAMWGAAPIALPDVRMMVGGGVAKLLERAWTSKGVASPAGIDADAAAFIEIYAERPLRLSRAFDGADKTLRALGVRKISAGLCTNKPEAISRDMMAGLGWIELLGAIVGGDTTPAKKPDPAPVRRCLDLLRSRAADTLLVGDSSHDLHAARAAGLRCALVTHGYSLTPVRELGPDLVIDRLEDVLDLLN